MQAAVDDDSTEWKIENFSTAWIFTWNQCCAKNKVLKNISWNHLAIYWIYHRIDLTEFLMKLLSSWPFGDFFSHLQICNKIASLFKTFFTISWNLISRKIWRTEKFFNLHTVNDMGSGMNWLGEGGGCSNYCKTSFVRQFNCFLSPGQYQDEETQVKYVIIGFVRASFWMGFIVVGSRSAFPDRRFLWWATASGLMCAAMLCSDWSNILKGSILQSVSEDI